MYFCKCFQICVSATVPIDLEASNMTWSPPTLHLSLHLKVLWEVVFSCVFNVILKHCTIFQKHIDDMVLLPELAAMSKFQGYQCIGTSRRMASSSDVCLLDERPTATSQHHHVAQLKRIETHWNLWTTWEQMMSKFLFDFNDESRQMLRRLGFNNHANSMTFCHKVEDFQQTLHKCDWPWVIFRNVQSRSPAIFQVQYGTECPHKSWELVFSDWFLAWSTNSSSSTGDVWNLLNQLFARIEGSWLFQLGKGFYTIDYLLEPDSLYTARGLFIRRTCDITKQMSYELFTYPRCWSPGHHQLWCGYQQLQAMATRNAPAGICPSDAAGDDDCKKLDTT